MVADWQTRRVQLIMIGKRVPQIGRAALLRNSPAALLRSSPAALLLGSHSCFSKYKAKSSKQIESEIALQKWKQLQNTFKSLNTSFGLEPPDAEAIERGNYSRPKTIDYTLQSLRLCSQQYPVYLYMELHNSNSSFHQVIQKVVSNLWKADKKEALEVLDFLYAWKYEKLNLCELYKITVSQMDTDLFDLFEFLKKFGTQIQETVESKVLERMRDEDLTQQEYGPLLKIVNYFTVNSMLSPSFYLAVTHSIASNINRISPSDALDTYIYYTYNIDEHGDPAHQTGSLQQAGGDERGEGGGKGKEGEEGEEGEEGLSEEIVGMIEKRLLEEECLKFYSGEQLVALLHTLCKNNVVLAYESSYFEQVVAKITGRIQLMYPAQYFNTDDKMKLLKLSCSLPPIKRALLVALVQRELLSRDAKFDPRLLVELYLASYETGLLTAELSKKLQDGIVENAHSLPSQDISRSAWLFTVAGAKNTLLLHRKIQEIIEGGLAAYSVKDVSVIVWSMCAADFNQRATFWDNIEAYLCEELQRKRDMEVKDGTDYHTINLCSWVLWAYLNNRELSLKTVDLISRIVVEKMSGHKGPLTPSEHVGPLTSSEHVGPLTSSEQVELLSPKSGQRLEQQGHSLTSFELINIVSFFYSIEVPLERRGQELREICKRELGKLYRMMECIELCKVAKFMGNQIWGDAQLASGVLEMFELEADTLAYRDIMPVVAVLMGSKLHSTRVKKLIVRLVGRKKRMESLEAEYPPM